MDDKYPHAVEAYLIHESKLPGAKPVARVVVNNKAESQDADRELRSKYPGCWIVHVPAG